MAKQPYPCPHCQGTDLKILPRNYFDGGGMVLTCQNGDCIARIWGHDEDDVIARWNRRTPPPATQAMLEWVKARLPFSVSPMFQAFLAEWTDPAPPPASNVTPLKPSPWKCAICDEPMRIGDDLQPHHIRTDLIYSHRPTLRDDDRKILADGLRLTD